MDVTTRYATANYEGRNIHFIELEVLGDKHTLSVRKYPKNISVKMWKNSDKSGTTVSLKMPHDKFTFFSHVTEMVANFETELDTNTLEIMEEKWYKAVNSDSF